MVERLICQMARWRRAVRLSARRLCVAWLVAGIPLCASAASVVQESSACDPPDTSRAQLEQLDVAGWLERMRQATESHTYSGKFMVTSSSGIMSHSRIWHVCSGQRQIERLEALNGTPRIVYRQNAEVRTFLPHEGVVRIESREMPRRFVRVKGIGNESLVAHYVAQLSKSERVAGREADLLQVRPRDASRFGYRIWLDRSSGLVLKWQTVAPSGRVLEEAVFSEIDMGAPLSGSQIEAMMNDVMGYRVIRQARTPTTLERNGWSLPIPVEGFVLLGCAEKQRQQSKDAAQASLESQSTPEAQPLKPAGVQCVYSDGLASISVFLEPFSAERHTYGAQALRLGATHTLSGRVAGDGWVTMVGEVPLTTLRDFASAIKQMP